MNKECMIVQDLIPLVNDGIASEESIRFVDEHCHHCEDCRRLLQKTVVYDEVMLNKKWNKKIKRMSIGIVILLIFIATSFTATSYQFHNFILIPFIGGLGYHLLKKNIYLIYIFVFLSQSILFYHRVSSLFAALAYSFIYWMFMSVGVVIDICLTYGLKKEEEL